MFLATQSVTEAQQAIISVSLSLKPSCAPFILVLESFWKGQTLNERRLKSCFHTGPLKVWGFTVKTFEKLHFKVRFFSSFTNLATTSLLLQLLLLLLKLIIKYSNACENGYNKRDFTEVWCQIKSWEVNLLMLMTLNCSIKRGRQSITFHIKTAHPANPAEWNLSEEIPFYQSGTCAMLICLLKWLIYLFI